MKPKSKIPRILIQFPTMGREKKFKEALKAYLKFMDDKENFFIHVVCEESDPVMMDTKMMDWIYKQHENIFISYDTNSTKIAAVNYGLHDPVFMDFCGEWDILLLASDDMIPEVQGYDNIIRGVYADGDLDRVAHFDDGHQGENLNTLSILGKTYFDRFGYIYNPVYISLYADNEFMEVSHKLGKAVYIPQCIIRHKHVDLDASLNDSVYEHNAQFLKQDFQAYNQRRLSNFDLPEGT